MNPTILLSRIHLAEAIVRREQGKLDLLRISFGKAVRAERTRRRISLKAFAIDLGRTSQMLSMMESGVREWPMEKAHRAVQLLARPEQWPDAGCPRNRH